MAKNMSSRKINDTPQPKVFSTDEIMVELRVMGLWREVMIKVIGHRVMTKNEWKGLLCEKKIDFEG